MVEGAGGSFVMKDFYRVMLGRGSMYAQECREQGYIGAGFDINQDLSNSLPEDWKEFNKDFIPVYLKSIFHLKIMIMLRWYMKNSIVKHLKIIISCI